MDNNSDQWFFWFIAVLAIAVILCMLGAYLLYRKIQIQAQADCEVIVTDMLQAARTDDRLKWTNPDTAELMYKVLGSSPRLGGVYLLWAHMIIAKKSAQITIFFWPYDFKWGHYHLAQRLAKSFERLKWQVKVETADIQPDFSLGMANDGDE